jgi:pimeloyl-ACP methyl ester carboxylesterase
VTEPPPIREPSAEVRLPQGPIRYRDGGQGEPIVFVHGLLVDGTVWRKVAPRLVGEFRCIVPDWPMGSHRATMSPDADLSALGTARLVADFLAALDLERATIVGSDTGGGVCQLVATRHPEHLARLVLTNCDACDDFPPFPFKGTPQLVRVPGAARLIAASFRLAAVRRVGARLLTKHGIPDEVLEHWARPGFENREVVRDAVKLVRSLSPRLTREALERLRNFDRPALIAWAPEDRWFKLRNAERLAEAIPDGRLELIADSGAFTQEDQPERLAELIRSFMRETSIGTGQLGRG